MTGVYDFRHSIELSGLGSSRSAGLSELYIPLNATTIEEDFKRTQDEYERERLKRQLSNMIDYVRWRRGSGDLNFDKEMDRLSALVRNCNVSTPCVSSPEAGQSLRVIVDKIITEKLFVVLGPERQKVGQAVGDCRFVCIFCHEVKVKTGDLRVHLVNRHKCDWDEVKQIFHRSKPQGVRVFGQYSYADVRSNGWDIKDWTQRKQRSEGTVDARHRKENSRNPKGKRLKTSKGASDRDQNQLDREENLEQYADITPGLTQDTITSFPDSPSIQTVPFDHTISATNIAGTDIDFDMLEELSSMENSAGDLAQIGTEFSIDSWSGSSKTYFDSSAKYTDDGASVASVAVSTAAEQYIDPRLLNLRASHPYRRSGKSFDNSNSLLSRLLQEKHRNHKT